MQPTSPPEAHGHHEDPREDSSDHPSHLYPSTAVDSGLTPGRHSESDSSISVAELVAHQNGDGRAAPVDGAGAARPVDGAAAPAPSPTDTPDASKWLTLVAVCLGTFMLLLDITVVNVALPDIQTALKSSFSDLQWVVDAYALVLAALLLTAGSLADLYGRRKLYVIGLSIFTIASLLCGVAQNTLMLQLSRALQGVGGAIMFSVSLALLAHAFRGKDRGVAFGIWGGITGLAVAIGPLLGGALTSGLSWRWIFFLNLPIGVAAVALTVLKVGESRLPNGRRPDWVGVTLFTVGLAALVYGLIESNEDSFDSTTVIASLTVAFVLLVGFLVAEWKLSQPMFDLTLFRKPTFVGGSIAAFGINGSIFSVLLYLVLYVQDVLGNTPFQTGLKLLILSGGILATSAAAGRLTNKIPVRWLIAPGLVLIGVGQLLMLGLHGSTQWTHLIPGLIVAGLGAGLVNPPLASTAIGVVAPARAGMASGINSTFRQVGTATGIALLGTLFASKITSVILSSVHGTPYAAYGTKLSTAVQAGASRQAAQGAAAQIAKTKGKQAAAQAQNKILEIAHNAFAQGLDHILLVSAIIALVAAVLSVFLIRSKDFASQEG